METLFVPLIMTIGLIIGVCDVLYRRIPNGAVLMGLILASLWHAIAAPGAWAFDDSQPGSVGISGSASGALVMFAIFFPTWLLGVMGAGDVKLLTLVGAIFGVSPGHWSHLPMTILYIAVAGGVLVLVSVLLTGRLGLLLSNMKLILMGALSRAQGVQGPVFDAKTDTAVRLPYGLAIVAGATAFVLSERLL
ncbi:MAG: A24 family peptidase [Quisquiliibacterium sp.]